MRSERDGHQDPHPERSELDLAFPFDRSLITPHVYEERWDGVRSYRGTLSLLTSQLLPRSVMGRAHLFKTIYPFS